MSAGAVVGAGANALFGVVNNAWADWRAREDRAENYAYNERSAIEADFRTRALYNDFYSPEALVRQYNQAGLSPSLMFGGTPGQGGMAGAKGAGAMGPQTPFMPISMVEAAQAAALFAQAEKTKAEIPGAEAESNIKELEQYLTKMKWEIARTEQDIIMQEWEDGDGKMTSIFEMAKKYDTWEKFIEDIRTNNEGQYNYWVSNEASMKALRNIYENAKKFERDIEVLSSEKTNAKLQKAIAKALTDEGFASQNATTIVKQLQSAAAESDLTKEQKDALNNIIKELPEGHMKDAMIILGMVLTAFIKNSGGHVGASVSVVPTAPTTDSTSGKSSK